MQWAVVLAAILALGAARSPRSSQSVRSFSVRDSNRRPLLSPGLFHGKQVGVDLCPTCIKFTGEAINELLDLILRPRTISFTINSKNGTGTGELILAVETVDGIPVDDGLLMMATNATGFPIPKVFTLKAQPNPDCDPTQEMCEMWVPGDYVLRVEICNGECGSKHPHSQIYDRKETNFTITG